MRTFTSRFSSVIRNQTQTRSQLMRWQPPKANYETQFGDYPKLPWVPFDKRDPNAKWDDPVHRRMFGETIPEEFDIQDAYFPGEHDPMYNFKQGIKGPIAIVGVFAFFAGLAYLTFDPSTKVATREMPAEVLNYIHNHNKDKVVHRPYETAVTAPGPEQVNDHLTFAASHH